MSLCPPFDFCPDGTNHSVTTVTLLNFCQNWVCYNSSQFGQNTPYIPWMIALMFLDCNVLQIRPKRYAKKLDFLCRINLLKTSIFGIISFEKIHLRLLNQATTCVLGCSLKLARCLVVISGLFPGWLELKLYIWKLNNLVFNSQNLFELSILIFTTQYQEHWEGPVISRGGIENCLRWIGETIAQSFLLDVMLNSRLVSCCGTGWH